MDVHSFDPLKRTDAGNATQNRADRLLPSDNSPASLAIEEPVKLAQDALLELAEILGRQVCRGCRAARSRQVLIPVFSFLARQRRHKAFPQAFGGALPPGTSKGGLASRFSNN